MWDLLAERAETTPDRVALIDVATDETRSFGTLDSRVDERASRLAGAGLDAGENVGVCLEPTSDGLELLCAIQRLGAVAVPLSPRLSVSELASTLERTDCTVLVCDASASEFGAAVEAAATPAEIPVFTLDARASVAHPALGSIDSVAFDPHEWTVREPVALVSTSGTTGEPRQVVLTMGNFLASACASAFRLGVRPDDRWLCCLSVAHVGGLSVLFRSLLYGTTVVLQTPFEATDTRDALERYDCTGISLVPTMLERILTIEGSLANSVRFVLLGGGPASESLLERCWDAEIPVCPTYGLTEATSQVATARPATAREQPGTVGAPLIGTSVRVLGDDGEPVERGEIGEIAVSGPTVTPGYYTGGAASPDRSNTTQFGAHGLETGDIGYRNEAGNLFVLGRRDAQIRTGGELVHPTAVEGVLRTHPAISEAAVVGLDDPEWGERVAALCVPAQNRHRPSLEAVRAHCAGELAGYKRPKTIVYTDTLPRTDSGTVERDSVRTALRERPDS